MTKADLLDWAIQNGCTSTPIPNDRVFAIILSNPKNNKQATFNTHRMDSQADPEFICLICTRLGIQVPHYGSSASKMIDDIDKMDF
jgi:hypothetical protein